MKIKYILIWCLCIQFVNGQNESELRHDDKIRIKEAITISNNVGDKLWKGFNKAPFAILLITENNEFLMYHPNPSDDFKLHAYDSILETNVYYRKRQFNKHFLATFPAVNGISCIVVGTPENTKKNSSEWIITLLHEHFHQYQTSQPNYYESVNKLDLANGDQTGMWMLNYPFPYDSIDVIKQYTKYAKSLYKAVKSKRRKDFKTNYSAYLREREEFKNLRKDGDYRYFSFQLWQESIARFTEYKLLKKLRNYKPSKQITELKDYIPFSRVMREMYNKELENLIQNKLNRSKRVAFYSAGLAEGLLLDCINKKWTKKYLKHKFYVENYK